MEKELTHYLPAIVVFAENGRAYPDYLVRYYRGYRDQKRSPFQCKSEAMKRSSWKPRDFNVAAANQDTSLDDSNDNDDLEAGTIAGWHFEDDDKSWKAYNDNDQVRLESAYRAHQKFLASSTSDRTKKLPTVVKIQS